MTHAFLLFHAIEIWHIDFSVNVSALITEDTDEPKLIVNTKM